MDGVMLGRIRGCAFLLFVLGVGAWVLPLFGRQFTVINSLSEDLGISPAALGALLVAAALLVVLAVAFLQPAAERDTDSLSPVYSRTSASPKAVQIVAVYLDEVSQRLKAGEQLDGIAGSIASRSGLTQREVLKALVTLGPAARQKEMRGGPHVPSPPEHSD
jgi:hypothetical protein